MDIRIMEVGPLGTNCYLLACPGSKEAVVVDPGGDGERILSAIEKMGMELRYIINTHGHHDHIGANRKLKESTKAELLIHKEDGEMLTSPKRNFSLMMGEENTGPAADRFLAEGDMVKFGNCELQVLHLPGHTRGGIGLYAQKEALLFSGDTLFYGSIGRTDLPGSDYQEMMRSLQRLMLLPDETVVYPGHGPKTSIAQEKRINPFI